MRNGKKITAYMVEVVYACGAPHPEPPKPWEKHGLRGWEPWGNPVAVCTTGTEGTNGVGHAQVFQAFVKYED